MRMAWIVAASLAFLGAAHAQTPGVAGTLLPDRPAKLGGIETVCTGIGLEARANPAWSAYSLKVEIAGPGGAYLGQEEVTVRQGGKLLLTAACDGPWLLFQLPAGRYQVEARVEDQSVSSPAFVPASGQGRIILRFKDQTP
jgi:hypothetical protein